MPLKTSLVALFLLLPGLAVAQACPHERDVTASACGEGQTRDAATGICLPATTS